GVGFIYQPGTSAALIGGDLTIEGASFFFHGDDFSNKLLSLISVGSSGEVVFDNLLHNVPIPSSPSSRTVFGTDPYLRAITRLGTIRITGDNHLEAVSARAQEIDIEGHVNFLTVHPTAEFVARDAIRISNASLFVGTDIAGGSSFPVQLRAKDI